MRRGESSRDLTDEPLQCTVKGDKFLYGGEEFARLKIAGEGAVKTIDLVFSGSDEAKEGIYTIEKETLKICLNWEDVRVSLRSRIPFQGDQAPRTPQTFQTLPNAAIFPIRASRGIDSRQT